MENHSVQFCANHISIIVLPIIIFIRSLPLCLSNALLLRRCALLLHRTNNQSSRFSLTYTHTQTFTYSKFVKFLNFKTRDYQEDYAIQRCFDRSMLWWRWKKAHGGHEHRCWRWQCQQLRWTWSFMRTVHLCTPTPNPPIPGWKFIISRNVTRDERRENKSTYTEICTR